MLAIFRTSFCILCAYWLGQNVTQFLGWEVGHRCRGSVSVMAKILNPIFMQPIT